MKTHAQIGRCGIGPEPALARQCEQRVIRARLQIKPRDEIGEDQQPKRDPKRCKRAQINAEKFGHFALQPLRETILHFGVL